MVFARLVSTALRIKPEFYLASIRNAVSQDNVWEPRVILNSLLVHGVSHLHCSRKSQLLLLCSTVYADGIGALIIMAVTENRALVLLQFLLIQKLFFKNSFVWRPLKQQTFSLITSRCLRWNLSWYPFANSTWDFTLS